MINYTIWNDTTMKPLRMRRKNLYVEEYYAK